MCVCVMDGWMDGWMDPRLCGTAQRVEWPVPWFFGTPRLISSSAPRGASATSPWLRGAGTWLPPRGAGAVSAAPGQRHCRHALVPRIIPATPQTPLPGLLPERSFAAAPAVPGVRLRLWVLWLCLRLHRLAPFARGPARVPPAPAGAPRRRRAYWVCAFRAPSRPSLGGSPAGLHLPRTRCDCLRRRPAGASLGAGRPCSIAPPRLLVSGGVRPLRNSPSRGLGPHLAATGSTAQCRSG